LESLSANGKKDEEITTQLTLVTNADINDLSSSDVTIKNISESTFLQATNVSGNHNGYQININGNWNEGDKVELSISKTGYTFTGTPSTTLHKPIVSINLLTLEANGKANEVETTQLSLTTSGSILDLLVEDVTLVNLTLSNRTIRCSNVSIGFDAKILISVFGD
jgi:hypothetical protein